ncbi:hypothetical protein Poly30_33620 [Planctomycetes bacterium Poly30]|uniref:Uncharacterized protein n=1 Tax=Saltatorellus ferox TaxID=2528018 RepID=A0A518EUR8_9BACT|nr:hypothetical protein Poly30_33620 [Planctomycetes bacterium Poly30]
MVLVLGALALQAELRAQRAPSCLVSDIDRDVIWIVRDLDADGLYAGSDEVAPFYDGQSGALRLSNCAGLTVSEDQTVWLTDTVEDHVLRLRDLDGDGDAQDAGEATLWYDGSLANGGAVELHSARGVWVENEATVWIATADSLTGGRDAIVRLDDWNGDGDALDPGEQLYYYLPPSPNGSVGDSIPTSVVRGPDGVIYYTDACTTDARPPGVYRLVDLNGSGVIENGAEVTTFRSLALSGSSATSFPWSLAVDSQDRFVLQDWGTGLTWRLRDVDGDGYVSAGSSTPDEFVPVHSLPAGQEIGWTALPLDDGSLYLLVGSAPTQIRHLMDLDGDDKFLGAMESVPLYDSQLSGVEIRLAAAMHFYDGWQASIGTNECGVAVPNSTGADAWIEATGSTSLGDNRVELFVYRLPVGAPGYFLNSQDPGFVINPGGSLGILCLGGAIGRHGDDVFSASSIGVASLALDLTQLPRPGGPAAAIVGDTWRFQAWYRDAVPAMASNLSNVVGVTITP